MGCGGQGCRNPGGIYPPNSCIPPNNWNGCTAERKFGEKNCSIFEEDLFFGLHLNSGRKSVLFLKKTFFFWSSPEFVEKKCSICIFLLVFTKFPHLNKIVVEVHPPMLKIGQNWGKIANYPPNAQKRSVPLVVEKTKPKRQMTTFYNNVH